MLTSALVVATIVSWVYALAACWSTWRSLHPRSTKPARFLPAVSLLKPVSGVDHDAYENFAGFCRQRYPRFELLFGVASAEEPCLELIRRLQADFPGVAIRFLVCPDRGGNPKSSILSQLVREARYEYLVISDSDIRVSEKYLEQVIAPLSDPGVGVVTCPYRTIALPGLVGMLESLFLNTTFLPSVLLADRVFGLRHGLGATLAMRRSDLLQCGGYRGVGRHLADDFRIARRIASLGGRIVISSCIVDNITAIHPWREQWHRELRWAAGNRVSRPLGYCCLPLTMSTPLACLLVAARPGTFALVCVGASLCSRWFMAWQTERAMGLGTSIGRLACLPLRDLLSALVWLAGLTASHITWRGRTYRLLPDGQLTAPTTARMDWRAAVVSGIDRLLRLRHGVFEFSDDPQCLLRVGITRSPQTIELADGTIVPRGAPVAELHFWNERLSQLGAEKAGTAWAKCFVIGMKQSFGELAEKLTTDDRLTEALAVHGKVWSPRTHKPDKVLRLAEFTGFEIHESSRLPAPLERWCDFWRQVYLRMLIWLFDKAASNRARKGYVCRSIWMSRREFLARYASEPSVEPARRASPASAASLPVETASKATSTTSMSAPALPATPRLASEGGQT